MKDPDLDFYLCRDSDASLALLFRFFCNNLHLGQWELARACADTLLAAGGARGPPATQILLECAKGLTTAGCRSDSVPNPHSLAWLALKEYEKWNGRDRLVVKLESAVELRLLLISIGQLIPSTYASELCEFAALEGSLSSGLALSAQCLEALQRVLRHQPVCGIRLLQLLFSGPPVDPRYQEVVLATLGSVLDDLATCAADDIRQIELLNKSCYDLLAALSTSCHGSDGGKTSHRHDVARSQMFERIVTMMATENRLALSTGAIYGSLLSGSGGGSKDDLPLLSHFCKVEEDLLVGPLGVRCGAPVGSATSNPLEPHSRFVQWRRRVRSTLVSRCDFLSHLLECAQRMAVEKRYAELGSLVSAAELSTLTPMVLQSAWQSATASGDDRRALLTVFAQLEHSSVPLKNLLGQLAFHADVTDWCLEQARRSSASVEETGELSAAVSSSGSRDELRLRAELLATLQRGSVLRALSACMGLSMLDEDEVRHYLGTQPVPAASKKTCEAVSQEQSADAATVRKTVRFDDVTSSHLPVAQRQRELSLFNAFCVLRRFGKIVQRGTELTLAELEASTELARKALVQIRPLTLCVEVIENAFALLFACHVDVSDGVRCHAGETSDEDGPEDVLKQGPPSNEAAASRWSKARDTDSPSSVSCGKDGNESDEHGSSEGSLSASTCGSAGAKTTGSSSTRALDGGTLRQSGTATDELPTARKRKQPAPGFLASASVVRCILQALMRAIADVAHEHPPEVTITEAEAWCGVSTVAWDDYDRRLSRLQQCLNEAWWRYQIMIDSQQLSGSPSSGGTSADDALCNSDDEMASLTGDDKSVPRNANVEKGPADVDHEPRRRKRHSRPEIRSARCRGTMLRPQALWKESTMSLMLAKPPAMIARCIARGQTVRAKKVVENCLAADGCLARELSFGERYAAALQRLLASGATPLPRGAELLSLRRSAVSSMLPLLSSGGYSLGALGDLAAAGAAAATSFSVADELLSAGPLPDMAIDWCAQCSSSATSGSAAGKGGFNQTDDNIRCHVSTNLVSSCVLLDLAAVACHDADQCRSYLASAIERLPATAVARAADLPSPQGAPGFLRQCYSLMAATDHDAAARFALITPAATSIVQQLSLPDVLLSLIAPLDLDNLRSFLTAVSELEKCENQLQSTMSSGGPLQAENGDRRSQAVSSGRTMLVPPLPVYMNLAVEQAAHAVSAYGAALVAYANRACRTHHGSINISAAGEVHSVDSGLTYLLCMYSHCKALRSLMDDQMIKDRERSSDGNCFGIMKQSPTLIMGRLIFERGISPLRLEPDARKLKLDLTHIIVRSCCRPVPCKALHLRPPSLVSSTRCNDDGLLLLNDDSTYQPGLGVDNERIAPLVGALQLAEDLLDQMISVVQSALSRDPDNDQRTLRTSLAVRLHTSSDEYAAVVKASSRLEKVSLATLATEEQRVCFILNVLNLLYLHGFIHCMATWSESLQDKAGFLAYASSIAYNIGELGAVSAFELEHFILRCGLPSELSRIKLSEYDPWQAFAVKLTCDWRVMFLVSRGTLGSPLPKVVRPHELSSCLATEAALGIAARVRMTDGHIELMEDLVLYAQDISVESAAAYERPYASLLRRLHSAADATARQVLEAALVSLESASPPVMSGCSGDVPASGKVLFTAADAVQPGAVPAVRVVVIPCNFELGYVFDSSRPLMQLSLSASFSTASLLSEPGEADSHSSSTAAIRLTRCDSQLLRRQAEFTLSAQAVHYLYDRAPVAAVLVDLLCSDRSLEARISAAATATTVQLQLPSVASALDSYPCLAAHVQTYVLPTVIESLVLSDSGGPSSSPDGRQSCAEALEMIAHFPEAADILRATMLAHASDPAAASVVRAVVTRLFERHQFTALLRLLQSAGWERSASWDSRCRLQSDRLRDYILMRLACESYSRQSADCARQIQNTGLQSHVILACLGSWSSDVCVDMLQLSQRRLQAAVSRPLGDAPVCRPRQAPAASWPDLLQTVSAVLDDMKLYQRIMEHANSQLSAAKEKSDKEQSFASPSTQFLNSLTKGWQSVREAVHTETDLVLQTLYAANDFESAVKLGRRHPGDHTLIAYENYLVFLLAEDKADFIHAEKLLEDVLAEDGHRCYAVGESALKRLSAHNCILFVTRFLLGRLSSFLGELQRRKLRATHLGAKVLLQLPERARVQCAHLVSAPMLMLEQLIMNSQIEWARTAIEVLLAVSEEEDMPSQWHPVGSIDSSSSLSPAEATNQLVEKYAEKALDYPLILSKDLSAGDSASGAAQTKKSLATGKFPSGSPVMAPTTPTGLKPLFASVTLSPTGASTPKTDVLKRIGSAVFGVGATSAAAAAVSGSPMTPQPSSFSQTPVLGKRFFIIPDEPPPKEQWVDDADASECMLCRVEQFSMFNRRHHCRRCGRVVCSSCSSKTAVVNAVLSRVCDECFAFLQQPRNMSPAQEKMKRIVERHSGNLGGGSPVLDSSPVVAVTNVGELVMTEHGSDQEWELTLDEKRNQAVRDEFYYDFAPSTSLCVSLLDLHSDVRRSSLKMLQLCDTQLAKLLVPLKPGQENREVDYSWVVSMMQFLVFNAKVRLAKCFDAEGQGSCDLYNSRVDILDLLVSANCRDIPAMPELSKMDTLRRLRDRLVEDERPTLAMEVSTKSGLDPSGAWAAWGFACLKSGDFVEARDKFSRCLKVPIDLNQQYQQSSKLVSDIVSTIESSQCTAMANVQALLSNMQDVKALIAEPSNAPRSLATDDVRMQECLFYLKTYGSHFSLVEFYRKNGFLQKAVQYILDKACSPDVFIESLLMPALAEGELGRLQDNLLMIDRTLERWGSYLLATCRHLSRYNYVNVLYEMQLFMKDYIRAAMTCIRQLYQKGAKSYADLLKRVMHLEKARSHLRSYLDPRQWGTVAKPPLGFAVTKLTSGGDSKVSSGSVILVQSPDEVNRHINTVDLQIDVTKFLSRYELPRESSIANAAASAVAVAATPGTGLQPLLSQSVRDEARSSTDAQRDASSAAGIPTLFGNSQARADVAVAVMSATGNPNDSFGLAFRIIQDYGLDYAQICLRVARTFVQRHNYTGVRQLLDCVRTSGLKGESLHDDIILTSLLLIGSDEQQAKEADNLIKLIRSETNRIEANVICGRLKSAYLVAVKIESVDAVRRIAEAARQAGQGSVAAICDKWLKSRSAN